MVDFVKPNLKQIEMKQQTIKPGITRLTFKDFEQMGWYYQSVMEELEAKGCRVVTVGIVMFIHEKKVAS